MNNFFNKLISVFLIILIVGLSFNTGSVFAQSSFDEKAFYDVDGDGVCNWKSGDENYQGKEEIARRYCSVTPYGDLCPGTIGSAGHFGKEDSGCSNDQLSRIRDYWSISAGELKPGFLKVNWLTDSRNGARAYQQISLHENFRTAGEEIDLKEIAVSCENDKGIVYQGGKIIREDSGDFVSARLLPTENPANPNRVIELKVHQLREGSGRGEVKTKEVSDTGGIDEIRTTCVVRTYSCRNVIENDQKRCINLYPPETDYVELRIPIDTVVVRPEAFLDRGIGLSQEILDLTNKLIPKVDKLYTFTLKWCGISLGIVSATKLFGFLSGFSDLAELIWYGPEELRGISFTRSGLTGKTDPSGVPIRKDKQYNSFIISGRSMCAAAVCPNDWCRLGNINIGGKSSLIGSLDKTEKGRQRNIQDSLLLSVGCGCVSGILTKLYQLRAIADSWNSCLKQAKAGETFKGSCDKILSNGICTFVFDELAAFKGVNLMSLAYEKVLHPIEKELSDAFGLKQIADQNRDTFDDFATSEVKAIGQAYGVGVVGYGDLPIARSICSLAVYGRLPTIDIYSRFDIDKPVIKTSANINWDSAQVIIGPDNQPVYEYSVEWMIVSGRDNLRYNVYLKTVDGGKSQRLDRESGRLARIGDYDSDYMQFVDTVEYVEACVEIPDEFLGPKCFAPGTGSSFGITGDFFVFSAVDDDDKDGLPNEWESRHGFDPNNWDSDGDNVGDGQEDSDQDGVNNYNEYKAGTDPKRARVKEDGAYVESECVAAFRNDFFLEKAVYNLGDTIRVDNLNVVIGNQADNENIALKVEITESRGDFRKNLYFGMKDIINKKTTDLWNIPTVGDEAPPNGLFDVRFSLIKWKSSLSSAVCVDTSGKISNSVKEMQLHIGSVKGCFDPDLNNIHTRGICIDEDNFPNGNIDTCTDGTLVEYVCSAAGKCMKDVNAKCSEFESCSDGKCVLKASYNNGICFEKEDISPYSDKCDPKDDTKIIKYDLVNDKCIERISSCGGEEVCKTKTIRFDKTNAVGRNELIGKSVNVGYCLETISGVPEGFTIFNPGKFPTDKQAEERVLETIKNLNSYLTSFGIWGIIESRSRVDGVDMDLILALITTESQGVQSSRSGADAVGIMQIVPSQYPALDRDRIEKDVIYNIEAGIKILASKESFSDAEYIKAINACQEPQRKAKFMKYLQSKKWDSALRLYNGGGCNCSTCDDDYVEKVNKYYNVWKITLKPIA